MATALAPPPHIRELALPRSGAPPAALPAGVPLRPKAPVFGIPIDLGSPDELLRTITGWVAAGRPRRVMYVNAHVLNQSQERPALRAALSSADLVYCDGYGVRVAAKALDLPVPHRMTGADWVWALAALCELSRSSIYLLGSEPSRYSDCPLSSHSDARPQIQSAPVMRWGISTSSALAARRTP